MRPNLQLTDTIGLLEAIWVAESIAGFSLFLFLLFVESQDLRRVYGRFPDPFAKRRGWGYVRRHAVRALVYLLFLTAGVIAMTRAFNPQSSFLLSGLFIAFNFIIGADGFMDLLERRWFMEQPLPTPRACDMKIRIRTRSGEIVQQGGIVALEMKHEPAVEGLSQGESLQQGEPLP